MTIFDYLLLFVLASSLLIGALRGFVAEILSLLGWVVAFVVANAYSAHLAALLPAAIPGAAIRLLVGFVALFIGVRLLMGLLTKALGAAVAATGLSFADAGMGALFGLARGLVLVLAAVILCGMTAIPQQPFWKEARFSALAESGARAVKPYLPAAVAQHVHF